MKRQPRDPLSNLLAFGLPYRPNRALRVFRDRTILENGTGLVRDAGKYVIQAATLRIAPSSKDSVLQIEMYGPRHVTVSASTGGAEVRNAAGVLIASLRPGLALAFDPEAGAATAENVTGTMQFKGVTCLLTDETTNVTSELRGTDLEQYDGKRVNVTGSIIGNAAAAAGASDVIHVAQIHAAIAGKAAVAVGAGAVGAGTAVAGTQSLVPQSLVPQSLVPQSLQPASPLLLVEFLLLLPQPLWAESP